MATPKQEKLIKLLMDNYAKQGETKTLSKLMIEAGYSKQSAKNPKLILDSEVVKDGINNFISMLDDKRRMAVTKITSKKLNEVNAYQLSLIADVFTKNIQLLNGKETENIKHSVVLPSDIVNKNK